jgi:hypothetical protein
MESGNTPTTSGPGNFLFFCKNCLFATAHRSSMNRHFRNVHGKKERVCCPWCPKKYLRSEYLKTHVDQIHTGMDITNMETLQWETQEGYRTSKKYQGGRSTPKCPTPNESKPSPTLDCPSPKWDVIEDMMANMPSTSSSES